MTKESELLVQTERISSIFANIITTTAQKALYETLGRNEMTLPQFRAMRYIARHGSCTIGKLAEGLNISQPAATMTAERMVRKGLIERHTGDDRRQSKVYLTKHGRDLLDKVESERTRKLSQIIAALRPEGCVELLASLEGFVSAALEYIPAKDACLCCGQEHVPECVVSRARRKL